MTVLDRVTNSVDQNGVVVGATYDSLESHHRRLREVTPDGGVERKSMGYSPFGMVVYTNQLGNITYYGYDGAGRKTAETNALGGITRYAYDEANDMVSLTDQNNNTTTWGYDLYGRATNKVDATSTTILEILRMMLITVLPIAGAWPKETPDTGMTPLETC